MSRKQGSIVLSTVPVLQHQQLQSTGSFFFSEMKVKHFLRFITNDVISQDAAYGTSRIKLDSQGGELLVPKQIRKLIPARIIAQYLKICEEIDFKPASPRTLLRILEVCPASTRNSLQGLDNYTADGSQGCPIARLKGCV